MPVVMVLSKAEVMKLLLLVVPYLAAQDVRDCTLDKADLSKCMLEPLWESQTVAVLMCPLDLHKDPQEALSTCSVVRVVMYCSALPLASVVAIC